jgi:hypothetical protein
MQHLLPRRWIAISILTLVIVDSYSAFATPKPRLVANHVAERVISQTANIGVVVPLRWNAPRWRSLLAGTTEHHTHRSGRYIFANTTFKPVIQSRKLDSSSSPRLKNLPASVKGVNPHRGGSTATKSLRGLTHLTDTDLPRSNQISPVDRLIK